MAKFLFMGVHGSEDPTSAAMPFIMATGAVSAGNESQIFRQAIRRVSKGLEATTIGVDPGGSHAPDHLHPPT